MKTKKDRRIKALIALLLTVSICAGFLVIPASISAEAISLPYIETIKASGSFEILEVVPTAGSGTVGYYVNSCEPCANWAQQLKAKVGRESRKNYINTLFSELEASGLLGTTVTSALKLKYDKTPSGDFYSESYLWETDYTSDLTKIILDAPETVTLTATFKDSADGYFRSNYVAEINLAGTHIQNIDHFTLDTTAGAFYYLPVFEELLYENKDLHIGEAMYTLDEESTQYVYAGKVGADPMLTGTVYYTVASTGTPQATQDALAPYAAVQSETNGFITQENGYFVLTFTGYTYVGDGNGDAEIDTLVPETTVSVEYNAVYGKTGFTNNNLFIKNVFDIAEPDSSFTVNVRTVVASELTATSFAGIDMVVIGAGYDPASPVNGLQSLYSADNDISDEAAFTLYSLVCESYPIVVDSALAELGGTLNISRLARLCLQDSTDRQLGAALNFDALSYRASSRYDSDGFFTDGSVLCVKRGANIGSAVVESLATDDFNTSYSQPAIADGFSDVLEEIETENFYRTIDETPLLDTKITLARVLRYIVNYSGRRITSVKESIKVLEIQPAAVNNPLSKSTVLSWIGGSNVGISSNDITIVTMTTGEFIGKIEEINEVYDLIYIGASTDAFNMRNGRTNFNDDNMDGLVYMNVGDLYRSDIRMAGLLHRDYTTTAAGITGIDATENHQSNLFRFSGNDITESKVTKLENFIEAGYPIVVDDKLMSGASVSTSYVDSSSYMYRMLNSVKNASNFMTVTETTGARAGTVLRYLQVSKPEIRMTKSPVPYYIKDNGEATTILKSADGYFYLEYEFSIHNVTDATPITTTYNLNVYIDLNADGKYVSTEVLSDVEVYSAGERVNIVIDGEKEYYRLTADTVYTVKRQMPTNFVGVIPWKLEIVKNGADHIHSSENGYTRIATATSNKQLVKVLQIAATGAKDSAINLSSQLEVDTRGSNPQLLGKNGKYYKGIYGKLIADLDDFNVVCDTLDAGELEWYGNSDEIFEKLDEYSMLIIGFDDMYRTIGPKTAEAITSFIASQKSVLFTHDTTSQANVPSENYNKIVSNTSNETVYISNNDWQAVNDAKVEYTRDVYYNYYHNYYSPYYYKLKFGYMYDDYWNDWYDQYYPASVYKSIWLEAGDYTLSCSVDVGNSLSMYVGIDLGNNGFSTEDDKYYRVNSGSTNKSVRLQFTLNSPQTVRIYFNPESIYNEGTAKIKDLTLNGVMNTTSYTSIGFDGNLSYWGYYFNTVIRDAVGLDRYGITSTVNIGDGTIKSVLFEENDSTDISHDIISAILNKERDVAYTPKSSGTQTVAETQGYTNYALIRYGESGWLNYTDNYYSSRETGKVSQVNEGQITTYPYNINTEDFGGNIGDRNIMEVGGTHEQYFQLNMSADDVVVWYCLTGDGAYGSYYNDSPNDVTNAYYIYNKGNVTYSGVGHTAANSNYTGYNIRENFINEAKLFVNTMIAAYQAGAQAPSLNIKSTAAGTSDAGIKYFVAENENHESNDVMVGDEAIGSENRAIYFKITEPNLDASKKVSLKYYIRDEVDGVNVSWSLDKVKEIDLTTYLATGEEPLTLRGGVVYKIYAPDEVVEALSDENSTYVRIYIRVCTEIGSQKLYGVDSVELRKIGLFTLS